ncbi:hypothetical protein DV515_00015262 [Chloebia gouldiae]|uniref:Uncharacterized protein n=1 Tax=Chloebia gouldiae TaxID=44316 RepID=A0A3L8RX93_CHLGU|nr:hypothetical protein DV515_00015262 [Chloebia gouldiae]
MYSSPLCLTQVLPQLPQACGAAGRTASSSDLPAVPREPPITVCCRAAAASPPRPAATGDEASWSHGCLAEL